MEFENIECFVLKRYDGVDHLLTTAGHERSLKRMLKKAGYLVNFKDIRPMTRPGVFVPRWENVKGVIFRTKQKELLEKMISVDRGQIWYPTGAGKSFLAQLVCQVLPKARIVITTKHQAVLKDIYEALRKKLPSVGILCSSKKKHIGARVMCVSSGSLHKARDWKPDLIIADEIHELATPNMLEKLSRFQFCRMIGMSANHGDRMDGADFELEGLFGPLVAKLTYQEAVDAGLIVPIEVHWRTARFKWNPADGYKDTLMEKFGLWQHVARNKKIARDAQCFPSDQVLITVKTMEHALHLKKYLPEFKICYGPIGPERMKSFKKRGLVSKNFKQLTPGERDYLKRSFENGDLKKVIATPIWNRGVNFHRLQVLIRADGTASMIDGTQIPGRLSRLCKALKKQCGILIDYQDQFDDRLAGKAETRKRGYGRKGWKQIKPENDKLFPKSNSLSRR